MEYNLSFKTNLSEISQSNINLIRKTEKEIIVSCNEPKEILTQYLSMISNESIDVYGELNLNNEFEEISCRSSQIENLNFCRINETTVQITFKI